MPATHQNHPLQTNNNSNSLIRTNPLNSEKQASVDAQLLEAAAEGNFERVKLLLKQGAKHAASDSDGATPLHLAAAGGAYFSSKIVVAP